MSNKLNQKGITLIALFVTAIILIILASTIAYIGLNIIRNANMQTLGTDMMLIQVKAKTIYEKLSFEKTKEELADALTGTKASTDSQYVTFLTGTAGVSSGDVEKYYVWDQAILKTVGLEGISLRKNEVFFVGYEIGDVEVISSIGHTSGEGTVYYKLSEIKDLDLEY